jgi:signal transduction histidine kinase
MRSARKISVGAQLTIAILMAILLSWVFSTGTASYLTYLRVRALHQEMLANPQLYPSPMPEPKFGLRDFFLGPELRPSPPPKRNFNPNMPIPNAPLGSLAGQPPNSPPENRPPPREQIALVSILVSRAAVALLLAFLVGKWLSRKFSNRLNELSIGANEFDSGNLKYRIPEDGEDEFTQVAATMNQMAERVSGQISRLEEDAFKRRQFLADVAHELRSPVTTLRTMAGALEDGIAEDPGRQKRAISSLVNSSDRLLHLISDLLELARLDLKELPINAELTDIRELTSVAVDSHEALAAQKKIILKPVEAGAPLMAFVDPDRLLQVLDNLLNNAISYAGEGSEVKVTAEDGEQATLIISDNGCGISAEHLPNVFDPFYRVDTARTPSEGHSGLGLRISRGLIEAQGGQLVLSSAEGNGTRAIITLPKA